MKERRKRMKKLYKELQIELLMYGAEDVLTESEWSDENVDDNGWI